MKTDQTILSIPEKGRPAGEILHQIREMKEQDIAWKDGRTWSLVYFVDEEHDELLKAAHAELFSANYLNPFAFGSLHRMEQEVVAMTARMLQGDGDTVGVMTSGGTESILLAMFCYRQRARKLKPRVSRPEVVAPVTIHPAFDKAALLFGLELRKAPVDGHNRAIPAAMEALVNDNTILLLASAPSYPNGILDPVEDIAAIAIRNKIPLHVDACIGGFMLPWVEKLGYPVSPWDFRVPGVSSVSADVHKFGFGAKGASVLLYRDINFMHHQFVVTTDFPGGIYISPTLMGTRPGGPIAAAWAALHHLGENGYLALAKKLMAGTEKLIAGLRAMPGIRIIGHPCMNIVSFGTTGNNPDILVIADQLEARNWMVDRQQLPDCIHLTVMPTNVDHIDQYLNDLNSAYMYSIEHPGDAAKGNAAIYGLMSRIPFRGMVEKTVRKIMADLYGTKEIREEGPETGEPPQLGSKPLWMGYLNRFLSLLRRWGGKLKLPLMGLSWWLILSPLGACAQPFVDPLQIRYTYGFRKDAAAATPFTHLWAGSDLPVKIKANTYLLLSPYFEQWNIDSASKENIYPAVRSLAFPAGLMMPLGESRWSLTILPTLRTNGENLFGHRTFQFGGAGFASYARKPTQKIRFGLYVNSEFFGFFMWPLLGADWRIDDKNYLFGLLPGRMTYEHKWGEKWYGGLTFRALTNSFRLADGRYLRLEDNQLSAFLDYYPAKKLCITLEPGFGVFRKMRTGLEKKQYLTNVKMGDGPFIRLSAAYRIRI